MADFFFFTEPPKECEKKLESKVEEQMQRGRSQVRKKEKEKKFELEVGKAKMQMELDECKRISSLELERSVRCGKTER